MAVTKEMEANMQTSARKPSSGEPSCASAWDCFFSQTTIDPQFCFDVVTGDCETLYTYFGDLQENLFYISDGMRDTFGFRSNLVFNLIEQWRSRIHGELWREKYDGDIAFMLSGQRDTHDLRYIVEDVSGRSMWIRCTGQLRWNEDHTLPLYFAGWIVKQDDRFEVDPTSNFLSEATLRYQLAEWMHQNHALTAIGFCVNHISYANKRYGRQTVDRMLQRISQRLLEKLSQKLAFYRLPGIRCTAVADALGEEEVQQIIGTIRQIVEEEYAPLAETSFCVIGIALLCMNLAKSLRGLWLALTEMWMDSCSWEHNENFQLVAEWTLFTSEKYSEIAISS